MTCVVIFAHRTGNNSHHNRAAKDKTNSAGGLSDDEAHACYSAVADDKHFDAKVALCHFSSNEAE